MGSTQSTWGSTTHHNNFITTTHISIHKHSRQHFYNGTNQADSPQVHWWQSTT